MERNQPQHETERAVLVNALHDGDPAKVLALLDAGVDLHSRSAEGYDALIDAVHGRDVLRDPRLIELLQLLIERGVALNGVTTYGESGLRALSRIGRFDAVRLLLDAGADASHLKWSPLLRAVALGSLADVEREVAAGALLEEKDWWERTPWLLAIKTGDVAKARYLRERGANVDARGRCGQPPLIYAIENHHTAMLQWLLAIGQDVEQSDDFDQSPLMIAADCDYSEGIDLLLQAGANLHRERSMEQTALSDATTSVVAKRLLDAGADPRLLTYEARRALLGFDPDPDQRLLAACPPSAFLAARTRRFGARNPERIEEPFWEVMIRSGVNGYQATQFFRGPSSCGNTPVWCAQRFGQSLTLLPDGRMVQIGGEHEDYYDPDFCIYNDVFVHERDGSIAIYAYPEDDFPPTDFHTATLIGEHIYVIGSLGYAGSRRYGHTPIYRFDTRTFCIEHLTPSGNAPGWIYRHRALRVGEQEIHISGGIVVTCVDGDEAHTANEKTFVLDLQRLAWRVAT